MRPLGLTTPLIYAAASCSSFFGWIKKASLPAKKAISGWFVSKEYNRAAVALLIALEEIKSVNAA